MFYKRDNRVTVGTYCYFWAGLGVSYSSGDIRTGVFKGNMIFEVIFLIG